MVIATALAGEAPENVQDLGYENAQDITVNLMETNIFENLESRSINQILNLRALPDTDPATHDFSYDLKRLEQQLNLAAGPLPVHCEYELEITVRDPDGELVQLTRTTGTNPSPYQSDDFRVVEYFPNNPALGPPTGTVDSPDPTPNSLLQFEALFHKIGTYEVVKTLRLKVKSQEEILTDITNNGLLPDLQTYIDAQLALIDYSECDFSCVDYCLRWVEENDPNFPNYTPEELQEAIDNCIDGTDCPALIDEAIGDVVGESCEALLEQMKVQVTPGAVEPEDGDLPADIPDFIVSGAEFPSNPSNLPELYYYVVDKDDNWYRKETATGSFINMADNSSSSSLQVIDNTGQEVTLNAGDFLTALRDPVLFQDQWAEVLVYAHREYCHYEECLSLKDSRIFEVQLGITADKEEAADFLNLTYGTGGPTLADIENRLLYGDAGGANKDPFYNSVPANITGCGINTATELRDEVIDELTEYEKDDNDNWQTAIGMVNLLLSQQQVPLTPEEKEIKEWEMYRGFYMDAKQRVLDRCRQNCDYIDDAYAIVESNVLHEVIDADGSTDPGTDIINYQDELIAEHNLQMQEGQVENWVSTLSDGLEGCNVTLTQTDINTIETYLVNYFQENYAYPLTTQLPTVNNYDCPNAIIYTVNGTNAGLYSNMGALPEPGNNLEDPDCFVNQADYDDVWFKFTPVETYATLVVEGGDKIANWLQRPVVGIYRGDCNDLALLTCQTSSKGDHRVTMNLNGLTLGVDYYVRVSGRSFPEDDPCYNGRNQGLFTLDITTILPQPPPPVTGYVDINDIHLSNIRNYLFSTYPGLVDTECGDIIQSIITGLGLGGGSNCQITDCFLDLLDFLNSEVIPLSGTCENTYFPTTGYTDCFEFGLTVTPGRGDGIVIAGDFCNGTPSDFGTPLGFMAANGVSIDWCTVYSITNPTLTTYNGGSIGTGGYTGIAVEVRYSEDDEPEWAYVFGPDCFTECGNDITVNISTSHTECVEALEAQAIIDATEDWQEVVDQELTTYYNELVTCIEQVDESFSVEYNNAEYHYTLYYHNLAGNLVMTLPPEAVHPLPNTTTYFNDDGSWKGADPEHHFGLATQYLYNSIEQVIWQYTPDGGTMTLHYDKGDRIKLTQDARQKAEGSYSYMNYDGQGRIVESGRLTGYTLNEDDLKDLNFPNGYPGTRDEVTYRQYDVADNASTIPQENLIGRLAYTYNDQIATRYSYDVHGNIKSVQHDIPNIGEVDIDYSYDLISSNLRQMDYQPGKIDQYHQCFEYDADNRVTHVYSSLDGHIWENDARYFYYAHGPLARIELGHDKVQGNDYYYNMQDWLKGVNMPGKANHLTDLGRDGDFTVLQTNSWFARDEYAYALAYHDQDYTPIGGQAILSNAVNEAWTEFTTDAAKGVLGKNIGGTTRHGLFNNSIVFAINDIEYYTGEYLDEGLQASVYQYDALYRLKQSVTYWYDQSQSTPAWTRNVVPHNDTYYDYDKNGNILSLQRYARGLMIDNLSYQYNYQNISKYGANVQQLLNNQLNHVLDNPGTGVALPGDPNYVGDIINQSSGNYDYDEMGNLEQDLSEGIADITWIVFGKVDEVIYNASGLADGKYNLKFYYDTYGNKLKKVVSDPESTTTYYIRDAKGGITSIYKKTNPEPLKQTELPIMGGEGRIGQYNVDRAVNPADPLPTILSRERGKKNYELANHLQSVMAAITDRKLGEDTDGDGIADFYQAEVKMANDYYPYGWAMPGRDFNAPDYRYGFSGKEKESEITNKPGAHYDFGLRIYDARLGRWLSIDPQAGRMPFASPYNYALNSPVNLIDAEGDLPKPSEKLKDWGVDLNPATAGLIDGLVEGFSLWGAIDLVADLSDRQFREDFVQAMKTIASDPVAFAKMVFEEEKAKFKGILEGSDQGKYDLSYMIGETLSGALSGGAALKLVRYAKKFSKRLRKKRKKCRCFTAGILIQTEDGLKPIEEIQVGDKVWSLNERTGEKALKEVTHLYEVEWGEVYKIYVGEKVYQVTHEHPFFTSEEKWVAAENLHVGDSLYFFNSSIGAIDSIKVVEGTYLVYNFTVDDYGTYFVGEDGVLVHNCPWDGKHRRGLNARQVAYGDTELSRIARKERVGRKTHNRNILVVQFQRKKGGPLETRIIESSAGKPPYERSSTIPNNTHSEHILLDSKLKEYGIEPHQVKKLYSELEPCTHCSKELNDQLPGVEIEFSYRYYEDFDKWKNNNRNVSRQKN
ncbi:MAG: polymorphic toxin-type HINT domain-containing protein [Bacteroidota bacterium]